MFRNEELQRQYAGDFVADVRARIDCGPAGKVQTLARQDHRPDPLVLTATNGPTNFLAVFNARTRETNYVPTGGYGRRRRHCRRRGGRGQSRSRG